MKPEAGKILISDPFLRDPNFARTIVLVVEHNDNGTLGFVLNNSIDLTLKAALKNDKLPEKEIYQGGPVELNTIHFLHTVGHIIGQSIEILPKVFWGGDFNKAINILEKNPQMANQFVFFLGYSGWGAGQLEDELHEGAWIVGNIGGSTVFNSNLDSTELWKKAMQNLGGKYALLINSPINPELN
ncbi:MAG: YqgE/AlgH family protein [Flavobacteriales bacterium]|nr:YqgE/AlgH family protein [Flavobacteriales bacterium]